VSDATQEYARQRQAMIDAARETPFDRTMAEVTDAAIAERARRIRSCAHLIFVPDCGSCQEEREYALRDGVGWARAVTTDNHVETMRAYPVTKEPSVVLTGEDYAAFEAFSAAAVALEQHAEQGQALQQRYRAELERVSRMAAKRARGA
jgi:hypothetical protein